VLSEFDRVADSVVCEAMRLCFINKCLIVRRLEIPRDQRGGRRRDMEFADVRTANDLTVLRSRLSQVAVG
jgi:hypothetical protein